MAVSVRLAAEADIPRILELYDELAITTSQAEQGRNPSPEECRQVFAEIRNQPGHELLIAEEEGNIIGTLVLLIVPNLSHGVLPWAIVENMIVDGRYRRKGVGRLLMDHAVTRARDAGCYKITLSSDKRRPDAHRFYRSAGFEASALGFRRYF